MEEFRIPPKLEDLENDDSSYSYVPQDKIDVVSMAPARLAKEMDALDLRIREGTPSSIRNHRNFDLVFALSRKYLDLSEPQQRYFVEIMTLSASAFSNELRLFFETRITEEGHETSESDDSDASRMKELDTLSGLRQAIQMYSFFLRELQRSGQKMKESNSSTTTTTTTTGKKSKSKSKESTFAFGDVLEKCLIALCNLLVPDLPRLWPGMTPSEDFAQLFLQSVIDANESPASLRKKAIVECVHRLFTRSISIFPQTLIPSAANSLLIVLQKHEKPKSITDLLDYCYRETGRYEVLTQMLQDIAATPSEEYAQSSGGVKSVSEFLVEITQLIPKAILPQLPNLLRHLSGESYMMRNGILSSIARLLLVRVNVEEVEESSSCISGLIMKDDLRDDLVSILVSHIRDVSAFTRARVLQLWTTLALSQSIPIASILDVCVGASGRLRDKTARVRKNALVLLAALVQFNPFSTRLDKVAFKAILDQNKRETEDILTKTLASLKPLQEEIDGDELSAKMNDLSIKEEKMATHNTPLQQRSDSSSSSETPQQQSAKLIARCQELAARGDELSEKQRIELERIEAEYSKCKIAYWFCEQLEIASKTVLELLEASSSSTMEVMEAIRFFVVAKRSAFQGSDVGVRKMLNGLFSSEATIREAVIEAYSLLLLSPDCLPASLQNRVSTDMQNPETASKWRKEEALVYAKNLLNLFESASTRDLVLLDELLKQMVLLPSTPLNPLVLSVLWDIFKRRVPGDLDSDHNSYLALCVLTCIANGKPSILLSELDAIESALCMKSLIIDGSTLAFAGQACFALTKLGPISSVRDDSNLGKPIRLPWTHGIFDAIERVLLQSSKKEDGDGQIDIDIDIDEEWPRCAQNCISAVYAISTSPESNMRRLCISLFSISQSASASNTEMSKLFFVLGTIAVKQLVHQDLIQSSLRGEKEKEKEKDKNKSTEDDVNLIAGGGDDVEMENLREEIEKCIIASPNQKVLMDALKNSGTSYLPKFASNASDPSPTTPNLLGAFFPLIVRVAGDPCLDFPSEGLRSSAVLALCKYCIVSEEICRENLQLLFTLLSNAKEAVIRTNIVICVGDLFCRFPNSVEPWTPHLYARLQDMDHSVKKNALLVLTHLILNDMVKVKGQVSSIARLLEDDDSKIQSLSKVFFFELSGKGHKLYNVITDIVSNLMNDVKPDTFRSIIKFLFSLLEKEGAKQIETLADKLVSRFPSSDDPEKWRSLAYCLTLINFTEKALKRLQDNSKMYMSRLVDDEVFELMMSVIKRARSSSSISTTSGDVKTLLSDLETLFQNAHSRGEGDDNEDGDDNDSNNEDVIKKSDDDDSDVPDHDENEEDAESPESPEMKRLTRKMRKARV